MHAPEPRNNPARAAALTPPRPWITPARLFLVSVASIAYAGWRFPTEHYLTPERGLGYALGILGAGLMLALLLYSARKRIRWLRFLGSLPKWFEVHMACGILGPVCILFHSNFSLGATNSNVALACMLTVAGSGFIGRYLYARVQIERFRQLFAIWHLMHLPLVFMLFAAAVAHVIAVHVY